MTELPDDELDKLFRKSSEEFDPIYEPEDWNALRKRLDRHDGKTPLYWLKKWWPLAMLGLLIPAGIAYYMLDSSNELTATFSDTRVTKSKLNRYPAEVKQTADSNAVIPELVGRKDRELNHSKEENKPETVLGIANSNSEKSNEREGKTGKTNTYRNNRRDTNVFSDVYQIKQKKTPSLQNDLTEREVFEEQHLTKQTISKRADIDKQNNSSGNQQHINDVSAKENTANGSDELNSGNPRSTLLISHIESSSIIQNTSLALPDVEIPQNDPQPTVASVRDLSPKLAVRFGYSPDMTTVGLKDFSKPGAAVSLMLEYSILPKLYLQTGIVRSVKDYRAGASEYALSIYVTNINTPYAVDGTCTMFEVPVGFRYDLIQKPRSRWFAGAAMSSYYVQKEKYIYNYEQYVHGQMSGWEGKTGWFWLSHLNASVGYEHRISNKLSIMAEPYIQLPLKGVGYGKVNLITTGMWLSVRYTPIFNR